MIDQPARGLNAPRAQRVTYGLALDKCERSESARFPDGAARAQRVDAPIFKTGFLEPRRGASATSCHGRDRASRAAFFDGAARAQRVAMGVSIRAERAAFFDGAARRERNKSPWA